MKALFLDQIGAIACQGSNMNLDVFRHHSSDTNVFKVSGLTLSGLRGDSTQKLVDGIEVMMQSCRSRHVVFEIAKSTLSSSDLTDIESAMRYMVSHDVAVCAVVDAISRPDFVRHHLMLVAPSFAATVAEAIILLVQHSDRRQMAA